MASTTPTDTPRARQQTVKCLQGRGAADVMFARSDVCQAVIMPPGRRSRR